MSFFMKIFRTYGSFYFVASLFLTYCVKPAYAIEINIKQDFDGDKKIDILSYSLNSNGMKIEYTASSQRKKQNYFFEKPDECSSMQLYPLEHSSRIAIDGSCSSRSGQIYLYVYQWRNDTNDWCLYQVAGGEKADLPEGRPLPELSVDRPTACKKIGDINNIEFVSKDKIRKIIDQNLPKAINAEDRARLFNKYISQLTNIDTAEISNYIEAENVRDINDLAYYLTEVGRGYEAAIILEKIIKKFPDRIVALLNLADAYWQAGFHEQAQEMYSRYINKMSKLKKSNKIPPRAFERSGN